MFFVNFLVNCQPIFIKFCKNHISTEYYDVDALNSAFLPIFGDLQMLFPMFFYDLNLKSDI